MFDGGTISLPLMVPESVELIEHIELELPLCMALQNQSKNCAYTDRCL